MRCHKSRLLYQRRRKQALQHTKELCQNAWDTFIEENQSADAITDEHIYDLYEALYDEIEKSVSAHLLPFALFERMRFFDKINDTRKKKTPAVTAKTHYCCTSSAP